jgi:HAD superfamily phosphoserine phosphatase-like hydrolase
MRLLFAGTPDVALPSLEALLASQHEVAAVLTRPPAPAGRGRADRVSPVHDRARELGIPVITAARLGDEGALDAVRDVAPDCCPVVAYGALITPEALALVRSHQHAGDTVMIVTATNEFVTRPIAQAFGVSELIAVDLERDASGWITGEIRGTPSFREGKVTRVAHWLDQKGLDWSDVEMTFYSDSMNDLPLLEKAHHPVATNPDARLRQLATERGWRILDLFQE